MVVLMHDATPSLDAALRRISTFGPEYGPSLSSHVPMVLEAFDRLGRLDLSEAHLEAWIPRLRRLDPSTDPALVGYSDTVEEVASIVARLGPKGALNALFERFAFGLHGAAFHGILRLGHAVRSLDRADSFERRDELVRALTYAIHRAAPPFPCEVTHPSAHQDLDYEAGMVTVDASPAAHERRTGLITPDLVSRLANDGGRFAAAARRLALPREPGLAIAALRRASLALFVRGNPHPSATFVLLHGVTAVDAVAALVPWLSEGHGRALSRSMATALLALRIAYVPKVRDDDGNANVNANATVNVNVKRGSSLRADLVSLAVESGDDHAIKLAAACVEGSHAVPDAPWDEALVRVLEPAHVPNARPLIAQR